MNTTIINRISVGSHFSVISIPNSADIDGIAKPINETESGEHHFFLHAIGFSFVFLWIVLPVSTFVISLMIGKNNYWSKWKRLVPIVFGIMHMIAEYATFSMRNMIAFNRINMPQFERILVSAFISLIGLWIGHYIHCKKAKNE